MTISLRRLLIALLALAALVAAAAALATPAAHARGARTTTCDISSVADRLGPTSVTSLKVANASCDTGKRVVRAFHSCPARERPKRPLRETRARLRLHGAAHQRARAVHRGGDVQEGRATVAHRYTQVTS